MYLIRGMMVNPSACLGCTWVMGVVLSHALEARFRTLELILWTVRRCWARRVILPRHRRSRVADTGQGVGRFCRGARVASGPPCPRVWAALRERRNGEQAGPLSRAPGL